MSTAGSYRSRSGSTMRRRPSPQPRRSPGRPGSTSDRDQGAPVVRSRSDPTSEACPFLMETANASGAGACGAERGLERSNPSWRTRGTPWRFAKATPSRKTHSERAR